MKITGKKKKSNVVKHYKYNETHRESENSRYCKVSTG